MDDVRPMGRAESESDGAGESKGPEMGSITIERCKAQIREMSARCIDAPALEAVQLRGKIVQLRGKIVQWWTYIVGEDDTTDNQRKLAQAKEALAQAKEALAQAVLDNPDATDAEKAIALGDKRAAQAQLLLLLELQRDHARQGAAEAEAGMQHELARTEAARAQQVVLDRNPTAEVPEVLTRATWRSFCQSVLEEVQFWDEHQPVVEAHLLDSLYKQTEGWHFPVSRSGKYLDLRLMDLSLPTQEREGGETADEEARFFEDPRAVQSLLATNCAFLLGASGCGKTSTIFQLARHEWVVFFNFKALDPAFRDPTELETSDKNLAVLLFRLAQLRTIGPELLSDSAMQCEIELVARFSLLIHLRAAYPAMTTWQFLLYQLNGGRNAISQMVGMLQRCDHSHLILLVTELAAELLTVCADNGVRVAFDEAHVAMETDMRYEGRWRMEHVDDEEAEEKAIRGMMKPLLSALQLWTVKTVFAGTKLGMQHFLYTVSIGAEAPRVIANEFAPDDKLVDRMLTRLRLAPQLRQQLDVGLLQGRSRMAMSLVKNLATAAAARPSSELGVQDVQGVVDATISEYRRQLAARLETRFRSVSSILFMRDLYCATIDQGDGFWLPLTLANSEVAKATNLVALYELLDAGVLFPSQNEEGHWGYTILDELSKSVLRTFLFETSGVRTTATQRLADALHQPTGAKGDAFEVVIAQAFCDLQDAVPLSQLCDGLPPAWAELELLPGRQLVSTRSYSETLACLQRADAESIVLMPDIGCGADIVFVIGSGDQRRIVSFGLKLYASRVPRATAHHQELRVPPEHWWSGVQKDGSRPDLPGRTEWQRHELRNAPSLAVRVCIPAVPLTHEPAPANGSTHAVVDVDVDGLRGMLSLVSWGAKIESLLQQFYERDAPAKRSRLSW